MKLKILHTSDLHLGKKLFKHSRLHEQQLFLHWLKTLIKEEGITHLVIAGDIFDSPYPPSDALTEYFRFIEDVTAEKTCSVIIISGNHDSGKFLEAPKNILKSKDIHIYGTLSSDIEENIISIKLGKGQVNFLLFPYFRHHEIYNWSQGQYQEDDESLKLLERIFESFRLKSHSNGPAINLLIAHHLFGNYDSSGSEYSLTLSGIESIPLSLIKNYFDLTLLGHIHKYQELSSLPHFISYAGSPLPFRFGETTQKFINIIEINENLIPGIKKVEIPTFRKIYQLKGNREIITGKISDLPAHTETDFLSPFLEILLEQSTPEFGLADYFREQLEKKGIELLSLIPLDQTTNSTDESFSKSPLLDMNLNALLEEFYKEKYPEADQIPPELMREFNELVTEAQNVQLQGGKSEDS